jgi:hypothetical protein
MSYTVVPQEGDGILYIKQLKTNQVFTIDRGTQSKFTENNRFLIAKIKPTFNETRQAKIGKKKPEEWIRLNLFLIEQLMLCLVYTQLVVIKKLILVSLVLH